jgi:hypothetical protein
MATRHASLARSILFAGRRGFAAEAKAAPVSSKFKGTKNKQTKADRNGGGGGTERMDPKDAKDMEMMMEWLEPRSAPVAPTLSAERQAEVDAIRLTFRQESTRRMNREVRARQRQVEVKQRAIAALPEELREHAETLDPTPYPFQKPPTLTPPIPGFVHFSSAKDM